MNDLLKDKHRKSETDLPSLGSEKRLYNLMMIRRTARHSKFRSQK